MNNYDELFVDDVMRECWERKAQVIKEFGGLEGFCKHLDDDRPQLEAAGWKFGSPLENRPSPSNFATQSTAAGGM